MRTQLAHLGIIVSARGLYFILSVQNVLAELLSRLGVMSLSGSGRQSKLHHVDLGNFRLG
jgi:hypothetical protein